MSDSSNAELNRGVGGREAFVAIVIASKLSVDAKDELGIMPKGFIQLDQVKDYFGEMAKEHRKMIQGLDSSRYPEALQAGNLVATMYENLSTGSPRDIEAFAVQQGNKCDREIAEVEDKEALLKPNLELIKRIKGISEGENYRNILGEGFVNFTNTQADLLSRQRGAIEKVRNRWSQAEALSKQVGIVASV